MPAAVLETTVHLHDLIGFKDKYDLMILKFIAAGHALQKIPDFTLALRPAASKVNVSRAYSYRSASIGSSCDARQAG